MRASDLRHIISFQSPTTASDGSGGKTASEWVTDRTTRARIVSGGADVSFENGKSRGIKNFTILTRYLKDYVITKKTRILWKTRILTPNVPVNVDSLEMWMTFEATENTD